MEESASLHSPDRGHVPVLARQVLELLSPQPGQVCLDCTVGRGGHAALLVERLAPGGQYIGLDVDEGNVEFVRQRLADAPIPVRIVKANFAQAQSVLEELGMERVDLLLADLGFSSSQVDDPQRGFSFSADGPLDMRMDLELTQTAADLVGQLPERELADLIYRYGEERLSRKIARKIVENRRQSPINTTMGLARLVRSAYGPRAGRQRIDPATRTFQALRIAVNGELDALETLLGQLPALLSSGGRAAVISFHSLEDRLVKRAVMDLVQRGVGQRLTKKPVTADEDERRLNPRSRSAKLRAVKRLAPA